MKRKRGIQKTKGKEGEGGLGISFMDPNGHSQSCVYKKIKIKMCVHKQMLVGWFGSINTVSKL